MECSSAVRTSSGASTRGFGKVDTGAARGAGDGDGHRSSPAGTGCGAARAPDCPTNVPPLRLRPRKPLSLGDASSRDVIILILPFAHKGVVGALHSSCTKSIWRRVRG